jgi:DnaJ-class molecular chaperone
MTIEEAYEILGISSDPKETIKKAYLKMSKENHPDKGGDPEKFLKIHEAYKLLTSLQEDETPKEDKIEFHVQVSLEEAIFGTTLETHLRQEVISSVPMISDKRNISSKANIHVLTVVEKIPPMLLLKASPVSKLHKAQRIGGSIKDIKVHYSIKEHERYKPSPNKDAGLLLVNEAIPVIVALQGGIIEVETLYGPRKLHIKPGTSVGDIYEIKGHGELGSLLVEISGLKMPAPEELSEKYKEMNENWRSEVESEDALLFENESTAAKIKSGLGLQQACPERPASP